MKYFPFARWPALGFVCVRACVCVSLCAPRARACVCVCCFGNGLLSLDNVHEKFTKKAALNTTDTGIHTLSYFWKWNSFRFNFPNVSGKSDLPTVPLLAGQSRFFTRCPASR